MQSSNKKGAMTLRFNKKTFLHNHFTNHMLLQSIFCIINRNKQCLKKPLRYFTLPFKALPTTSSLVYNLLFTLLINNNKKKNFFMFFLIKIQNITHLVLCVMQTIAKYYYFCYPNIPIYYRCHISCKHKTKSYDNIFVDERNNICCLD